MPRHKQALSLVLVISFILLSIHIRVQGQQEDPNEIKVAKDQTFILELLSPISTATNKKGDSFSCRVIDAGFYKDAIVSGFIRKLKRSGKANGRAEIDLAFESITIPDGRSGGFNAQVVEVYELKAAANEGRADPEGTVRTKSRVKVSVKRAVAGAVIGGIIGGAIGGGQGAAVGAAIGAGLGVTSTLVTDGPDLEFKQGTQFKVMTNAPTRREKRDKNAESQARQPTTTVTAPSNAPLIETGVATTPQTPESSRPVAKEEAKLKEPVIIKEESASTSSLQPLSITPPRPPSKRLRIYTANAHFRLSIPANWRESSSENPVTFAPEGGYVSYQEKLVLIYGIRAGLIGSQGHDLQQSTAQLLTTILQEKSYLSRTGEPRSGEIAKRPSLTVVLSGKSNVTGQIEIVNLSTVLMSNGDLFYIMTCVPQNEYTTYQTVFRNILSSIQIND